MHQPNITACPIERRDWLLAVHRLRVIKGLWRLVGYALSGSTLHYQILRAFFFHTIYYLSQGAYVHAKLLQSRLTLCDPVDYTCQTPLSMGFSRQAHWNGLPCPPPGDLPNPEIQLCLLCFLLCKCILYCWATGEALVNR